MKTIVFFILIASLAFSCKESLVPKDEIPNWLKERIEQDESAIQSDPQSGLDMAAWKRYKYDRNEYFEYENMICSSCPKIYTYNGTEMIYTNSIYNDYSEGKCCMRYVWKGPAWFENE